MARVRAPKARAREVRDAAVRVFHRHGYGDATIQQIADEVGILKGSLYHYIDSKEDLLFQILTDVHAEVGELLGSVHALPDAPPLEHLAAYVRLQVEYASARPELMTIYFRDLDGLSPARREAIRALRHDHEAFVTGLLERAQAEGAAVADDPRLLANFVFGTMMWVHRWYRPGGHVPPTQLGDLCSAYVLRGVRAS
jgi:AcrR family transcriptional regulator